MLLILLVYQDFFYFHVADEAVLDQVIELRRFWCFGGSRGQGLHSLRLNGEILDLKALTTAFDLDFGVVDCSTCGILASPERLAGVLLVLGESLAVLLHFDHALIGLIAVATGSLW